MSLIKLKAQIQNNLLLIILFVIVSLIEIFAIFPLMFSNSINYDSTYQYALTQHSFSEIWRLIPYDYSPPFYAVGFCCDIWQQSHCDALFFNHRSYRNVFYSCISCKKDIWQKFSYCSTSYNIFFTANLLSNP